MKKYGVMLETYGGQPFNMWVYESDGRFETYNEEDAWKKQSEYSLRNPKGWYRVKEIENASD